jgi:diguanylate cyclase (GGDEF)-like protein
MGKGFVGKVLIFTRHSEEREFLFNLAQKEGLVYTTPSVEKAASLLSAVSFNIMFLGDDAVGHPLLKDLLSKVICLILVGRDEEKLKDAIRDWPPERFVDYILVSTKPLDVARARRVIATAGEVSRLKTDVARLSSSKAMTERQLHKLYAEIKDLGGALSSGLVREIEKRASLEARYSWFQTLKQKFEDILRKLYAANDVSNLLSSVLDIKDIVLAASLSIYILEDNDALGQYLKPLVWDDAYLTHAEFNRHIALLHTKDFAAEAARTGEPINVVDPRHDPRCTKRYLDHLRMPIQSLICLPLKHDSNVVGVLEVYNKADDGTGKRGFTEEDRQVLRGLSEHIAIAMTKLNLIQYDALTGLLRPDPFLQKIIHKLESSSKRRQETGSFAMVMGDVDWFKHYNDRNGHEAGNRLLRDLAGVLKSVIREGDLLCRYGGEEFLFFLTGVNSIEEATLLTERIRKTVEEHVFEHEQFQPRHNLTMSFGVTLFPRDKIGLPGMVTRALLKTIANEADLALAEAKGKRMSALHMSDKLITKNRVCAYVRDKATVMSKTSILKVANEKVFVEKRKFPRYYTSTMCLYRDEGGHKVGSTVDLSFGGARISAETQFPISQMIDLFLVLGSRASTVHGEVVYCRKASPSASYYYTGVRFRELTSADREALAGYFVSLEKREIPLA